MITSYVKRQLAVFSALAISAVLIIVFGYAHIPTALGFGQMDITALFNDGAGIYVNGNVTARGVQIGKVTDVSLTPQGVAVTMSVSATAKIAADAHAAIHSQSAVGEQYVDLISNHHGGPYLRPGAVIPLDRTTVPEQIAPVLDKATNLLASIPNDGLQTFLDEGYRAFNGLGPNLRTLVDASRALVDTADQNYPQTAQLIDTVGPLLDTQNVEGDDVRGYFAHLAHFTGVLAGNDRHLRHGLPGLRDAADSVSDFLGDTDNGAAILSTNLRTVGRLLGIYRPGIEQVLVDYPLALGWEQVITQGPNRGGHAGFQLTNVYPGCTTGFDSANERNPNDVSDRDAVPDTYCKVAHNDPRVVRGARNIPCLEGHVGMRAATVQECLGVEPDHSSVDGGAGKSGAGKGGAPLLDPVNPLPTGGLPQTGPFSPDSLDYADTGSGSSDPLAMLGGVSSPDSGRDTPWQSLLTGPLNR